MVRLQEEQFEMSLILKGGPLKEKDISDNTTNDWWINDAHSYNTVKFAFQTPADDVWGKHSHNNSVDLTFAVKEDNQYRRIFGVNLTQDQLMQFILQAEKALASLEK